MANLNLKTDQNTDDQNRRRSCRKTPKPYHRHHHHHHRCRQSTRVLGTTGSHGLAGASLVSSLYWTNCSRRRAPTRCRARGHSPSHATFNAPASKTDCLATQRKQRNVLATHFCDHAADAKFCPSVEGSRMRFKSLHGFRPTQRTQANNANINASFLSLRRLRHLRRRITQRTVRCVRCV